MPDGFDMLRALPLLLAAAMGHAGSPPGPAPAAPIPLHRFGALEYSETGIPLGAMTVHAVRDGAQLSLSLREGAFAISLTDNGSVVAIHLEAPRCGASARHLRFEGRVGEPALFDRMLQVQDACRLPADRHRAFRARMRASRLDFVRGVQHMKARAEILFGGWRQRCAAPPALVARNGVTPISIPSPHDPCS
jgi:hypothetical protein